jgi:hypothetical protein
VPLPAWTRTVHANALARPPRPLPFPAHAPDGVLLMAQHDHRHLSHFGSYIQITNCAGTRRHPLRCYGGETISIGRWL